MIVLGDGTPNSPAVNDAKARVYVLLNLVPNHAAGCLQDSICC
jgi:hypothetical protein